MMVDEDLFNLNKLLRFYHTSKLMIEKFQEKHKFSLITPIICQKCNY